MRNWPVAYRDLYNQPDDPNGTPSPAVDFGVATLPGNSILGGENLAISATTDKPRAAQALVEFLTNARSQQILFERGGYAATREVVYHDSAVQREYPYTMTLLHAIQKARPRPVTPCYPRFTEAVQTAVTKALVEDEPIPDDFIDTLKTALRC